ncbi:MAG TPA: endolytic transglycosylase MltG [Mycobacteriales bacterium]|nr:endolytic transglycosylase MltG [Mycobacteriales bacterium]
MSDLGIGMSDEPDPPRRGPRTGVRWDRLAAVAVAVIVVLGLAGYGVHAAYDKLVGGGGDFTGDGSGSVQVVIHDGDSAATIGQTLAAAGVVRSASAFTSAAAANPRSRQVAPGTYDLHEGMKASLALDLLLKPSSLVAYTVTIPEGFTADDIVARLAADTPISASSLRAVLRSPQGLQLSSYADGKPEGFLFPATYQIQPGTSALQALRMMVVRFNQAAQDVHLAAGARRVGLSEHDVVTLASIVQREGRLVSDYPKIAEVFLNRLHDGMRLDSDATLYYVLGPNHGPLTAGDLQLNSPYNTRLNPGLPPTPINSPGQAALEAVLHHAHNSYLYFVTIDKAGHTAYARTLSEFNALVAESRRNGVS